MQYIHENHVCPLCSFKTCFKKLHSRLQVLLQQASRTVETIIDLPHMNLIIFLSSACLPSLFKHNKSSVVFHCSDFCNLLYKVTALSLAFPSYACVRNPEHTFINSTPPPEQGPIYLCSGHLHTVNLTPETRTIRTPISVPRCPEN